MAWTTKLLVMAVLAAGCGDDDDCVERVLEACPDCGSGDVLAGVLGETFVAPRADGGWIARSCDGDLVWRDRDLEVEARVATDVYGVGGRPSIAAVDDVAVVTLAEAETGMLDLAAIGRDGNTRWRTPIGPFLLASVSSAGDAVFVAGEVDGTTFFGETVEAGWKVAQIDPADGQRAWMWEAPAGAEPTSFAPFAVGGGAVGGSFTGAVDFGAAGVLDVGGDTAGFVVVLGPNGTPEWARALTSSGSYAEVDALGVSPEGEIGVAGVFAGELDLGDGAVVSDPGEYGALLAANGTARWGAGFIASDDEPRRVVVAGRAVVIAGQIVAESPGDMYLVALRDGAVAWQVTSLSPHEDLLYDLASTVDDTVLVSVKVVADPENAGGDPVLELGRVEETGPLDAVLEIRP